MEANLAALEELNRRREKMEYQLGIHHPSLRNGDSLFQEFESVDLTELNHDGYRKLMRDLRQAESRIYAKTKFDRMVRWECANLFYLVAPRELIREGELPADWGLLCQRAVKSIWQNQTARFQGWNWCENLGSSK